MVSDCNNIANYPFPNMPSLGKLPAFIAPMLATPAEPFDSDDFLFDTQVIAQAVAFDQRVVEVPIRTRYHPDASSTTMRATVLDGEIILLKDGKPSFALLLSREQARTPLRIQGLSKAMPATFMVFDLLYEQYEPWMNRPLRERRARLAELIKPVCNPYLQLSDGITGKGSAYFAEAVRRDLEGVVAKRLDSRYLPGQRNDAWLKIKRQAEVICAVIGFVPSGPCDPPQSQTHTSGPPPVAR